MSNFTFINTTQTGHPTNNDKEVWGTPPYKEWIRFSKEWSEEPSSEMSSNYGTNGETFLNVQVPSCQNFALGDTRIKKYDREKEFLPESETIFSQITEKLKLENAMPLSEDKTEPFSLNEENSLEHKPIFSEFIEELLFESTPLFDNNDNDCGSVTDMEQADDAQSRTFLKTSLGSKNISTTLKTLIENLEELSKSLDSNTKSFPILPNKSQLKAPEATSKRQPGSMNPQLKIQASSSLLIPSTIQNYQNIKQLIRPSSLQYSDGITTSSSIASSLKAIEPSPMLPITVLSDCSTSSLSPEQPIENSLFKQSEENLVAEPALHKVLPPDSKKPADADPSIIYRTCSESPSTPLSLELQLHADEPPAIPESSTEMKSSCLINFGSCCDQTVQLTASQFGFEQSSENWDLLWVKRDPSFNKQAVDQAIELYQNLKSYQRVNHFPGNWGLGLKDLLAKNLNYMYKYFPYDYSFFPNTWILPTQSQDLAKYMSYHPESYFVIGPAHPSSGYKMEITKEIHKVSEPSCEKVCQVYLKPFSIYGYKFDFRVYVLVTSCDPLRIFVHSEGLTRIATEKYEKTAQENWKNMFMHLTNTRGNVRNPAYVRDEFCGSLRRISTVFQWLKLNNCNVQKIQASMDDAVIKTIISNLATLQDYYQICFPCHSFSSACFEILGFDIILDDQLKVYLLDVDCSPSFDCESGEPFETELKKAILRDSFMILNLSESKRNQVTNEKENSRRLTLLERLMRRKQEISAAQSQIEWEDSHLGGFRKIYPPVACCKAKYYRNLIDTALKNPSIV